MDKKQLAGLQASIESARLIKEMQELEGWKKVLKPRLDGVIMDQRNLWLKAKSAEVAEIIRLKTAGYTGILDLVQKILAEGENAQTLLRNSGNKPE